MGQSGPEGSSAHKRNTEHTSTYIGSCRDLLRGNLKGRERVIMDRVEDSDLQLQQLK